MSEYDIEKRFAALKIECKDNPYIRVAQRITILRSLKKILESQADKITKAIDTDFSCRSMYETSLLEIYPLINTLSYCIKNVKNWSKTRNIHVSWLMKPAEAQLYPQALGLVGIMVPWNYPLYLSLAPAAYAIAAGNRVMIKLSELTPEFGALMAKLLPTINTEKNSAITVINGGVDASQRFASLPWDHLLFTGSSQVGKKIMEAASQHLTPVTLELGGKSPAIICESVNEAHLLRLLMGKCFNAGQTCIAPDYVLIDSKVLSILQSRLEAAFSKCYPKGVTSNSYSSIISDTHFNRLMSLLNDAKRKGASVSFLNDETPNATTRKFPPCLVFKVSANMALMQEEIFGPILPIMTYDNFHEAVAHINTQPHPLALYYFGSNKDNIHTLRQQTHSGALTINHTLMHLAVDALPFGGVGNSGMGCYHGEEGFKTFSHFKPIFKQKYVSTFSYLYPPYGRLANKFLDFFSKSHPEK